MMTDRLNSTFVTNGAILIAVIAVTMVTLSHARPVQTAFASMRHKFATRSSAVAAARKEGMPELPSNVVKYSQVPKEPKVFTADTIPRGLLKEHSTKKGTWGIINVRQGALQYQINEPLRKFELNAPDKGVIEPKALHQVKPLTEDVEFVVEFYRVPGTGPVDEKREGL